MFLASLFLTSCSPFYVVRAAYEETKILLKREDIKVVLSDSSTPTEDKRKLELVLAAREFATRMGLTPNHSFTKYSKVNRNPLAWVLVASKVDSFTLFTWWFPIVGRVPYKGFFEQSDALRAAKSMEEDGYETWVRGTDAFSTLGWFNDPLLSTTLAHDDSRIVNTVIHETVHSTVWIPGSIDFNESLANFVGLQGAMDFYEEVLSKCEDSICKEETERQRRISEITKQREFEIASAVTKIFNELDGLYRSSISRSDKLSRRDGIFEESVASLRVRYPKMEILKKVNNAEIIQLKLYMTALPKFESVYLKNGKNWGAFLEEIRAVGEAAKRDKISPFVVLAKY